ncbi:MAG: hypothetical protein FGM58_01845 [Acidimicrobiia bacterium]|nr:hypothetical protein [Acidimicrobiia bacterium]
MARSVQTTVGWIFWDPGAVERYAALGIPEAFASPGGYIATRAAPLAPAGPEAVIAAFGSISPAGIRAVFDVVGDPVRFLDFWHARDEAIVAGLHLHAPDIVEPLREFGPDLWAVVERLPLTGRVLFGAVRAMPRPYDPLLSGWHAVNALREWRGDTHWAVTVAAGLDHAEASILHNAWLGYESDWLALSRGTAPADIEAGWSALSARGLAVDRAVTEEGLALRQRIEDDTDRLTVLPWHLLGPERTDTLVELLEPPCTLLLERVDVTAGPNYQPGSRVR